MKQWLVFVFLFLLCVFITSTPALSPAEQTNTPLVSKKATQMWNLQDANIRAVIEAISKLTGKNFIVDPRVQGKVTIISSKPMQVDELYQVFLSMLQVLNYVAIPAGKVIKIIPVIQAKEYAGLSSATSAPGVGDEVVVRVIGLNSVSAQQLVPALQPLIEEWGTITAYSPSNTLILAGSANNVNRLVAIIHTMDEKNASRISVVRLRYANAKKIVETIKALQASERSEGKVSNVSLAASSENNAILISGNAENRYRVKALIQSLDTPNSNGDISTVVLHLKYLGAKKLAPILLKVARGQLVASKEERDVQDKLGVGETQESAISVQAELDDNAIIISAPSRMITALKRVVKQLDIRPEQVLVQAIIVRVDENTLKQLGVQWGTTNPFDGGDMITATNFPAGIGFIPHGNITVLVQALMTNASTDILATPSVVVLNNKSATISDGKNVGIINRQYAGVGAPVTDNSALPFNTIQRQDVTLQLKVKPQITPDNTINLEIDQQDNSLDPEARSGPENPTIDTSKINTSVLVNSGDILVLGGLISNDNKEIQNKIPVLGDIPILGYLFRYKNHDIEKKNLMVFIRPVILHTRRQTIEETRQRYDYMRYQEQRKRAGLNVDMDDEPVLPPVDKEKMIRLPDPFESNQ